MNVLEKILEEIEEYRKNNNPIANRTASEIEEIIRSHKDDVLKCNECKRRKWYQIGFIDGFKAQPEQWIPPFDYFSENYKIVAYQQLPEPYKGGDEK